MTRRRGAVGLWLALAAGGALACEGRSESVSAPPPSGRTARLAPQLLEPGALRQALGQVIAQGGPAVQALELSIHADRIVLQAQDPKRAGRVLQFEYREGALRPPIQVRLQGAGALEDNLFPLAEANLEELPVLMNRAVESVDPQHGKVTHILLRRNLPHSMDIQFRVYVASPSKDGHLDADHQGKPLGG